MFEEGLAEHFANHRWDGRTLHTGVWPDFQYYDIPAQVLTAFQHQRDSDVRQIVAETKKPVPPEEAGAFIGFLMHHEKQLMQAWWKQLDSGSDPTAAWDAAVAACKPEGINQRYVQWLKSQPAPLTYVEGYWDEGAGLIGKGRPRAVVITRPEIDRLSARVVLRDLKRAAGGVVYSFRSPDEYCWMQVEPTGGCSFWSLKNETVTYLGEHDVGFAVEAPIALRVRRVLDRLLIAINGKELPPQECVPDLPIGLVAIVGAEFYNVQRHQSFGQKDRYDDDAEGSASTAERWGN